MPLPNWIQPIEIPGPTDVWRIDLDQPPDAYRRCLSALTPVERERLLAYGSAAAGDAFVIRRGGLRLVLATRLDADPSDLDIRCAATGKPYLIGSDLSFSVSSSRGVAVVAVNSVAAVGVDVEWIDPHFEFRSLLGQYFTASEIEKLKCAPPHEFYEAWVRKEAWAKATGQGLSAPLTDMEVLMGDDTAQGVQIWPIEVGPEYCAAVAVTVCLR